MNGQRSEAISRVKARAKSVTIGCEIECIGRSPNQLRDAVQTILNAANADGTIQEEFTRTNARDRYGRTCAALRMRDGRVWVFTHDGSLSTYHGACEVVSPILKWADISTLQAMVRAIREAGCTVDRSCGFHVHIGATEFTPKAFRALMAQVGRREALIMSAVGMHANREHYAHRMNQSFRERFRLTGERASDGGDGIQYARRIAESSSSRYQGVNLQSLFERPTVEFRWFNGTLHAGRIKAYVQLCAHLVASALETRVTVWRSRVRNVRIAQANGEQRFTRGDMTKFLRAFGIDQSDEEYATAFEILTRRFRRNVQEAAGE